MRGADLIWLRYGVGVSPEGEDSIPRDVVDDLDVPASVGAGLEKVAGLDLAKGYVLPLWVTSLSIRVLVEVVSSRQVDGDIDEATTVHGTARSNLASTAQLAGRRANLADPLGVATRLVVAGWGFTVAGRIEILSFTEYLDVTAG